MQEFDPNSASPENAVDEAKKIYAKPQVIYSASLEAMASVCSHTPTAKTAQEYPDCAIANS